MFRSHLTQQLLNYFDPTDRRVREYPYTLDAQILNCAAVELEDLQLRFNRELDARFTATCPSLIDNRGIYYGARLPLSFPLPNYSGYVPVLNQVQGLRNGNWQTLPVYDDRLPVPARITLDQVRSALPLTNPVLFDSTGNGSALLSLSPAFVLPIPMPLTFWLENLPANQNVSVTVQGLRFPYSAWQKNRTVDVETVLLTQEGLAKTRKVWARIDQIQIRNLPQDTRLRAWHMPFNLPGAPDTGRPFTHHRFRDLLFDRYWQALPGRIQESYEAGALIGLEYVQSYATPLEINDLTVEPRTNGLLSISNSMLYYSDRREPFPSKPPAPTSKPAYSVKVIFDVVRTTPATRFAQIIPLAHAGNPVRVWRYVFQDPQGSAFCVLPSGVVVSYAGSAGWSTGTPTPVSVPLLLNGTYQFSVECLDTSNNVTTDTCPYLNLSFAPLVTLDLSTVVPQAQGITYDYRERLWIWTGSFAVPVVLNYDAYVLDTDTNSVYLTDPFDQIKIS